MRNDRLPPPSPRPAAPPHVTQACHDGGGERLERPTLFAIGLLAGLLVPPWLSCIARTAISRMQSRLASALPFLGGAWYRSVERDDLEERDPDDAHTEQHQVAMLQAGCIDQGSLWTTQTMVESTEPSLTPKLPLPPMEQSRTVSSQVMPPVLSQLGVSLLVTPLEPSPSDASMIVPQAKLETARLSSGLPRTLLETPQQPHQSCLTALTSAMLSGPRGSPPKARPSQPREPSNHSPRMEAERPLRIASELRVSAGGGATLTLLDDAQKTLAEQSVFSI